MRWLSFSIIVELALQAQPLYAQDIERARQLFQEASSLREAGMYAEAVSRLRLAIAIKDTPGLEYHAGFCEAKLGHFRLAIQYYERAAALLRAGASAPDVIALLPPAHASALEQVAKVRINLNANAASPRLRLDEEAEQPLSDADVLVDPGKHRLVISAAGYTPQTREITVGPGEQLKLDVKLTPKLPDAFAVAPAPNHFPWKPVSIGLGLGITATGLGVGIVSAAERHNAQGRINLYTGIAATCAVDCTETQTQQTTAALAQAKNDKQSATRWETVGFVTAGAGAAATILLWSLWPASQSVSVAASMPRPRRGESQIVVTARF